MAPRAKDLILIWWALNCKLKELSWDMLFFLTKVTNFWSKVNKDSLSKFHDMDQGPTSCKRIFYAGMLSYSKIIIWAQKKHVHIVLGSMTLAQMPSKWFRFCFRRPDMKARSLWTRVRWNGLWSDQQLTFPAASHNLCTCNSCSSNRRYSALAEIRRLNRSSWWGPKEIPTCWFRWELTKTLFE